LVNDGIDIVCMPEFVDVTIDEKVRTAVKFVVTPRGEEPPREIDDLADEEL
jgi:stage V sporulation protein SpoVS